MSTIKTFANEEIPVCDFCGLLLDGPAENYVIWGKPAGEASKASDQCYECDAPFTAMRVDDEHIQFNFFDPSH